MLGIVAVLAWSTYTAPPLPTASSQTVVVNGPGGKHRVVVLKAPTHATTATSAVARP
jgi:hypothetical protein